MTHSFVSPHFSIISSGSLGSRWSSWFRGGAARFAHVWSYFRSTHVRAWRRLYGSGLSCLGCLLAGNRPLSSATRRRRFVKCFYVFAAARIYSPWSRIVNRLSIKDKVPVDPKLLFLLLVPRAWDNLDADEGREARLSPRELVGILKYKHTGYLCNKLFTKLKESLSLYVLEDSDQWRLRLSASHARLEVDPREGAHKYSLNHVF